MSNLILILNKNEIKSNTLNISLEKSKTFSIASPTMKNTVAPSALCRFPLKLICYIAYGSVL